MSNALPATSPAPPPAPKRVRADRAGLYIVLAIGVVIVVLLAIAALHYHPLGVTGTPSPTTYQEVLFDKTLESFGPGFAGNVTVPFVVPSNALNAYVNGSFEITTCASPGNYCLGNAAIYTPSNWQGWQKGESQSPIWCNSVGGMCQATHTLAIRSTNLVGDHGQTLDLCFWSNATAGSQEFSAEATLQFTVLSVPA
ncbi:MAG: hypothetical protein WA688_00790 [Thermoplasmata archaeon]